MPVEAQEEYVYLRTRDFYPVAMSVVHQCAVAGCAKGDDTFFIPFPKYLDVPVLEMNVIVFQGYYLGEPEPGIQHQKEYGCVPRSQRCAGVHVGEDPLDFPVRQDLYLLLPDIWRPEVRQPVAISVSPPVQP